MDQELQRFVDYLGELGFEATIHGPEDVTIQGRSAVSIRRSGGQWHAYPYLDRQGEFGSVPAIGPAVLSWLLGQARDPEGRAA